MVRVAVLWHWGGIYSDTDSISIKPYSIPLNAVGVAFPGVLANGFLTFTSHHPILWAIMEDNKRGFIVSICMHSLYCLILLLDSKL